MTDIEMSDQFYPVDDEDTIMHDASMLPVENTDLRLVDSLYDPMDISPVPMRAQSPVDTQPKGTVPGHLPNPSSHSAVLGQNTAATPSYGGRGFFNNNVTRSPFIRVAKRFSPKSPTPPFISVNPPRSVLGPLRLQSQNPQERMKQMFRLRPQASVMGIQSQPISEHKTAEQSSQAKPNLHLGGKESSSGFKFPFSVHEQELSRKRCHSDDPVNPDSHDGSDMADQVNAKYRRVSINDFPASATKVNNKDAVATSTTAPNELSSPQDPTSATTCTELPHAPPRVSAINASPIHASSSHPPSYAFPPYVPSHDNHTSPDRVTDARASAQVSDQNPPAAASYHMPGAWPESPEDEDIVMSNDYESSNMEIDPSNQIGQKEIAMEIDQSNENEQNKTAMDIDHPNQNEQIEIPMEIDQNERIIQSVEFENTIFASNDASPHERNANVWHAYLQAVFQGTTKAVGTLLHLVRDTFASTPSFMPFADRTFSVFRRRRRASPERRRGSRESSPTHHHSPTRVNLRSLTKEQRDRIRCRQWLKDNGLAGPSELPFPELHIEPVSTRCGLFTTTEKSVSAAWFEASDAYAAAQKSDKRSKNPKFTHRQRQSRRQKDQHRSRRQPSSPKQASKKAKGKQPVTYGGVHKRSKRSTPRKKSTAASPQQSQAASPNVHRPVYFATGFPKRYPELAEKERRFAEWRNSLGRDKRQKALEAQVQEAELAAAAAKQKAATTLEESHQPMLSEEEAVVRHAATGPAKERHTSNENDTMQQKKDRKVRWAEPLEMPTPIAPHVRPAASETQQSDDQKENVPPATQKIENEAAQVPVPEVVVENEADQATVSEPETDQDPWLRMETPFGRPVSAVRMFYPDPQPIPAGRTESIYAAQWRKKQEEEERKKRQTRIRPEGPAVRPLSEFWEQKLTELRRLPGSRTVATTLAGDPLSQRDMATCYTPLAWLNDEMINSYLALIIEYLRRTNNNAGRHDLPRFHAFNSFFFSNLRDKGYGSVRRWASRAKIGGEALLDVDTVFVPVHHNSHWTLIVVKPMARTIEHFDSLGPPSRSHIAVVQAWLREELGPKYSADQWTALPSRSPQQNNGSDCGAFLLSTAKAVAIGLEPLSYGAADIPLLRRRIVAELMAGRLEGEFDPAHGGEVRL